VPAFFDEMLQQGKTLCVIRGVAIYSNDFICCFCFSQKSKIHAEEDIETVKNQYRIEMTKVLVSVLLH